MTTSNLVGSRRITLAMAFGLAAHLSAHAPASADVFGLKSCGSGPDFSSACNLGPVAGGGSMPPTVMYSFSESGATLLTVSTVTHSGTNIHADALAIDAANTLFAYELATTITPGSGTTVNANVTASQLVTLNPVTGAVVSVIGDSLTGRDIRGAAFGPSGQLWVVDAIGDALLRIDPATGAVQSSVGLTFGGNPYDLTTSTDIAVRADGTAIITDLQNFYRVDLSTGTLTLLFSATGIGLGNQYAGITFSAGAADNLLFAYEISGGEDIRNFDLANGNLETSQMTDIVPFFGGQIFNAGRGDLAARVNFVEPVPEPSTIALMGAGLVAFRAAMKRRRRN